jgi:hypothetical protein
MSADGRAAERVAAALQVRSGAINVDYARGGVRGTTAGFGALSLLKADALSIALEPRGQREAP